MQLLKRGASQALREVSCARSAIVLPDLAPGILPVVASWQISTPWFSSVITPLAALDTSDSAATSI